MGSSSHGVPIEIRRGERVSRAGRKDYFRESINQEFCSPVGVAFFSLGSLSDNQFAHPVHGFHHLSVLPVPLRSKKLV